MSKLKHYYHWFINWISQNKILTIILILAVLLRFIGIYPGFPPTHSDEGYVYASAVKMIKNSNLIPLSYGYPALLSLLHAALYFIIITPLFIIYSYIFSPDNLPIKYKNILDFCQQIIWWNQQTAVIYWGRFITASFGTGIVLLVYQVGRKFFNSKTIGLVAAFLTAVNFRQVLNSHISLPDIYNAFFLLLSFYALANLLKKPNKRNYILSGVSISMYLSIKFQFFSLFAFGLIHLFNTWGLIKNHSLHNIIKNRRILLKNLIRTDFIISLLLIPIIFLITNPYLFLNWNSFISTNFYQMRQYRLGINNLDFYSLSYLYHTGIGGSVSIFVLLGIVWGLRKYVIPTLLFLSTIIPFFYFLVYYSNGGFYTRNFVTIIPLLLIFAGLFLVEMSLCIGQKLQLGKNLIYCLMILILFVISWGPIKNSVLCAYYFSQPQNYRIAKQWAEENIPNGSTVAARTIDKFDKKKQFKIVNFEYNDVFSLAEMQEAGVDYSYVPLDELNLVFYWWMKQPSLESLAYWDKNVPDSISQNMFTAKVANELASWSIAAFIKPWQAPDVNYLTVKVPKKLEFSKKKIISQFTFDTKEALGSWSFIYRHSNEAENISFGSLMGHFGIGSVRINKANSSFDITRVVSSVIPLDNNDMRNRAYEITGWIKTEKILDKKEKDGYLIVDFYNTFPGKIVLTTKSLNSAVSSRVFGTSDWTEKSVTVIAPKEAKFMAIGLGASGPATVWFDDITVAESEEIFKDPRAESPYLNYYQIPENILFPLSHGGW